MGFQAALMAGVIPFIAGDLIEIGACDADRAADQKPAEAGKSVLKRIFAAS